ncbi:MAG: aldo/keto reductase [Ilumatobacter sp.]
MVPTAVFGRTGHLSSRVIFGGAALGEMSQRRAYDTLEIARAAGVNHYDTAHSYGHAEDVMQPWLAEHRASIFLATKTGERTGDAARAGLELSLGRMCVERVELIQLHNLVEIDEWETAFRPGGAVEALAAARDEGLVDWIGVTGHGVRIPSMHVRSLAEFDFDSVLFPFNHTMLANPAYRSDVEELLAVCADRNVAVQTIKSIAKGRWSADYDGPRFSWYEPLTDHGAIGRAVRNVLSREQLFLNSTSDANLLPAVLETAAGDLTAPSVDQLDADVADFDMTPLFDGAELELM